MKLVLMNRRGFLLTAAGGASVALAAPAIALTAPEFEITRPDPGWEILRRADLLRFPWQVRMARKVNGLEHDFAALFDHYPTEKELAGFRKAANAAFDRAKARV